MFAAQRQEIILRDVQLKGASRVSELAVRLQVSELTIRRDLTSMEAAGLLVRVHGGARALREREQPGGVRVDHDGEIDGPPKGSVDSDDRRQRRQRAAAPEPRSERPANTGAGQRTTPVERAAASGTRPNPLARNRGANSPAGLREPRLRSAGGVGRLGESAMTAPRAGWRVPASEPAPTDKPRAVIGIIVPSSTYYYAAVLQGAKRAARQASVRLILGVSSYDSTEERSQIDRMMRIGVDALLVTPSQTSAIDAQTYRILADLPIPVVMIERDWTPPNLAHQLTYVRTDHDYGARLAVRHLAARGHERIAVAANTSSATTPWILQGYRSEMRASGLPQDLPMLQWDPNHPDPEHVRAAQADVLHQCLAASVTAVLFHADHDAVGFVHFAHDQGVDVPRDLAVIAYDDEIAALADPPLTAIAPPKQDVGQVAVDLCVQLLCRPDIHATRRTLLLPELIVRESA